MYEGLLEVIRDAEKVSSLVDAVGSGLRPGPFRQIVKQVAEVVERVSHPRATFFIPPCNKQFIYSEHVVRLLISASGLRKTA